jgi:hypothetical protein
MESFGYSSNSISRGPPGLFKIPLPGFNLHSEIILIWGDDTDILIVIDTGGVVGHIEINDRFIPWHDDLRIQVAAPTIGPVSIGFIPEGDKEMIAAGGFIDMNKEFTAVELKANPPVSDVSLLYPLIREEIGVVFGIHNVIFISLDLSLDPILQVNGIIV